MTALEECHAQGFLVKISGTCNDAKTAVNKCLRAERLKRQRKNLEEAMLRRAQTEAIWKELDEEI